MVDITKVEDNVDGNTSNSLANNIEVVDIAGNGIPTIEDGKIYNSMKKSNRKPVNKGLVGGIIGGTLGVIAVVVVLALFITGAFDTIDGFGDAKALSVLKSKITGSGADLEISASALPDLKTSLDPITKVSGVVLRSGDGEVAEVGKQVNFNAKVYAFASDEMLAGKQGGVNRWQMVESTWDEGQSMPVELKEKSNPNDLNSLLGTSNASSGSANQMTYYNDLMVGQKVGTVWAIYMPSSQTTQGTSPAMLLLGELDYIGDVGSDPGAPEVKDAPEGTPEIKFDENGKPTGFDQIAAKNFKYDEDKVYVKVIKEGDGAQINATDTVSAKYAGYLLKDGTEFDASFKRGDDPTQFSLDKVIKGWKYGIAGQKVGSQLEIIIPAKYGYGEKGSGEVIPPNSTLVFYVDIVSATDAASAASSQSSASADDGSDPYASSDMQ